MQHGAVTGGEMDERFEGLVLAEIHADSMVMGVEQAQRQLYAKHDDGEAWLPHEVEMGGKLKERHAVACLRARAAAEKFWAEVRPGRVFLHAGYGATDREPERFVISKLMYCRHGELFQLYYRTADGDDVSTQCAPMYFRSKTFGRWA